MKSEDILWCILLELTFLQTIVEMKSNHLVTLNPITDKKNLFQTIVHGFLLERTDHAIF